jgi:hypothetical protein
LKARGEARMTEYKKKETKKEKSQKEIGKIKKLWDGTG